MPYSNVRRKKLAERIDKLGKIEHGEIYRKLSIRDVKYSTNNNGVFFDITDVDDDLIEDLEVFVDHCLENQKMLTLSRQEQFKIEREGGSQIIVTAQDVDSTDEIETFSEPAGETKKRPESPPSSKASVRFQQTRKKYSRQVTAKTNYVNDLLKE